MNPELKNDFKEFADWLFVTVQRILPTTALSTAMFHLTRIRAPGFKNAFIRIFMRMFGISLAEAEFDKPQDYEHFNAFFTRRLKAGTRPLDPNPQAFISPVDGTLSQFGSLAAGGRLIQAKGRHYSAADLLGSPEDAARFERGSFCTLYLAPYNYHRIHMPMDARLHDWRYLPGRLFSVNQATARGLTGVFTRNERICAVFDTAAGPLALVMVGALFVGSLETVWAGQVSPPHHQAAGHYEPVSPVKLLRGGEMGRFNMGSTVILLAAPGVVNWRPDLTLGATVRMGQALGLMRR